MQVFERRSLMPASAGEVYDWHLRPGSFARMTPPWNRIRVLERTGNGFEDGARLVFEVKLGPVWRRWVAEHHGNVPGRQFADRQVEGPFRSWDHTHRFVPAEQLGSEMIDHIEFGLPAGALGDAAGGGQARKTLEPIRTVLNAPMERAGDSGFAGTRAILGKLDFINVGFTYPGSPSPSLNAITLSIRPGERIGIIGRVGSGKSTLLRLIVRLLETNEGAIQLDDRDIRQYAPRDIRRQIAYMRQDSSLFDDTLRANLFFGLDQPDQRLVDHALAISGVAQFASKNAEGFGFRVGPRGERLSGGERQAVGLARAMIGDPKMLLLDEPTAAMDNTIERQIINGIAPWLNGKTLIVATHRAALLDLVDRVILMQDGRIVADGPKDQVLRNLKAG